MSDKEITKALQEFVGAFEIVFRYDWEYTTVMFGHVNNGANFIEPELEDETEDWGARGALLEKYRNLVAVMKSNSLQPEFPFPLENLPEFKARVW